MCISHRYRNNEPDRRQRTVGTLHCDRARANIISYRFGVDRVHGEHAADFDGKCRLCPVGQ